jgi:hypothetical protein
MSAKRAQEPRLRRAMSVEQRAKLSATQKGIRREGSALACTSAEARGCQCREQDDAVPERDRGGRDHAEARPDVLVHCRGNRD